MIYKARVIDNSMFKSSGQIRVRIFEKTKKKEDREDLSLHPETISAFSERVRDDNGEEKLITNDHLVYVSTPFGGGTDYGMFWLPQPNSIGLVADLGDIKDTSNNGNYVWLGGLFSYYPKKTIKYSEGIYGTELSTVDVPNLSDVNKSIINDEIDPDLKSSFIIKTKTTEVDNIDNPTAEKLDFKKSKVENTFIMNKKEINVSHGDSSKLLLSNEDIKIEKNTEAVKSLIGINKEGYLNISTEITNEEGNKKEIKIYNNEEDKLILSVDGINDEGKAISAKVTIGSNFIGLEDNEGSSIKIEKGNISLFANGEDSVVNVSADTIRLGNGNRNILAVQGQAPEGTVAIKGIYV